MSVVIGLSVTDLIDVIKAREAAGVICESTTTTSSSVTIAMALLITNIDPLPTMK